MLDINPSRWIRLGLPRAGQWSSTPTPSVPVSAAWAPWSLSTAPSPALLGVTFPQPGCGPAHSWHTDQPSGNARPSSRLEHLASPPLQPGRHLLWRQRGGGLPLLSEVASVSNSQTFVPPRTSLWSQRPCASGSNGRRVTAPTASPGTTRVTTGASPTASRPSTSTCQAWLMDISDDVSVLLGIISYQQP